ncbi:hypothetical protein [Marinomonas sp. 2405UD68-3]|uniref:hypothetical protein n=1 Tax=Marinomonas sp. 2405UD68-3 TaxID=3391835 RepID=UPI0039C94B18
MKTSVFKEPNQWILFIALTIATINGVVTGQYFTLLTGVPFLLVSVLASTRFHLQLWILFVTGAIINIILAITTEANYFIGGVYGLLTVYGFYELFKWVNDKEKLNDINRVKGK